MHNLQTVQQLLPQTQFGRERLVRAIDMLTFCQHNDVMLMDSLVDVAYIDKKGYELYHYRLTIEPSDGDTFEALATNEQLSSDILEFRRKCFIQMTDDIATDTQHFKDYLIFILTDANLQEYIRKIFGSFDKDNLFLNIFTI